MSRPFRNGVVPRSRGVRGVQDDLPAQLFRRKDRSVRRLPSRFRARSRSQIAWTSSTPEATGASSARNPQSKRRPTVG